MVPHQKLCPDGVKQKIFVATPNQPSANFQPVSTLAPSSSAKLRWKYTADRADKWGWIVDEDFSSQKENPYELKALSAGTTLDELGFRLSFDLTEGVNGAPPLTTVMVEFMKSYSPEWGSIMVWFNDSPSPSSGIPGLEDSIKLESRWEKQSSLSRVVVIHAAVAANDGNATKKPLSPFADFTYYLKRETELKTIHIEPFYSEIQHAKRFKFKLSGLRAC